jgi:predicted nucleic acid-binding protein
VKKVESNLKKKNLYDFVLDCSITMAWCFEDENTDYTNNILENLENTTAVVPTIWSLEVANVLLLAKKNKRISEIQSASFIDALLTLPIVVDTSTSSRAMHSILFLANQLDLTIYDAAYLELAMREKIPLITLDKKLIKAANELEILLELPVGIN